MHTTANRISSQGTARTVTARSKTMAPILGMVLGLFLGAILAMALVLAAASPVGAQQDPDQPRASLDDALGDTPAFDPGAGVTGHKNGSFHVHGRKATLRDRGKVHAGMFVSDGHGGYVWIGSEDRVPMPGERREQARELRMRIRELAERLIPPGTETDFKGLVALPASFVNQDNFDQSSSFGRYLAEQMFHELHQRGVMVSEYRARPGIQTRPLEGEFAVTRDMDRLAAQPAAPLVLTGSYYHDKHNIMVNARLFRAQDRMVLRTAVMVMAVNETTWTMLSRGLGVRLRTADIGVKDFSEVKDKASLGFALMEDDLH